MADKTNRQIEDALLAQLKNPFDPKFIKWRVGSTTKDKTSGLALAYIDSREVKKRLDEVCGLSGWRDRLIPVTGGFICEIDIKINGEWITRSNGADNTKMAPLKGGSSDAFKRAAAKWGIGHYLYYLKNAWVPIKQQGESYVLTEIPQLPDWALPGKVENWEDVAALASDASSGADNEVAAEVIESIDFIRNATSETELYDILNTMSEDRQLIFANEIAAKRRELNHANRVHADSSPSAPAIS